MPELVSDTITAVAVPPPVPVVGVSPPSPPGVTVLAVPGIPGPPGPAGDDPSVLERIVDTALMAHSMDPTPHAAYDEDMPDLVLLFENGLL